MTTQLERDEARRYRCDCECHKPMGWTWKAGDPIPPNMRACGKCDHRQHWEGGPVVPSGLTPGGSCRVPNEVVPRRLVVRRHTEQTRAAWKANLMLALPEDMLLEDRDRIADALLESAIAMGDELRRKRLVDKLHHAADEVYHMDRDPDTKLEDLPMEQWQDVLRDAADEIRSMLP